MKTFLIVVIFNTILAGGYKDSYVFTSPKFDSFTACVEGANDPVLIRKMTARLVVEYQGSQNKEIEKVVCAEKEEIEKLLNASIGVDT